MPARRSPQEPRTPTQRRGTPDVCDVRCIDVGKVARVRRRMGSRPNLHALADTFKLLGDPTRLRIAVALSRDELCVCDIANVIGASQSVVSHSLRALREMRVVRYRKEGKIAYYRLDDDHIARLLAEGLGHVREPGSAGRSAADPGSPRSYIRFSSR